MTIRRSSNHCAVIVDEGHKVARQRWQAGIDTFRTARHRALPFDIVITESGDADVDGRQVVASLRAMSPDTPIILLTGCGTCRGPQRAAVCTSIVIRQAAAHSRNCGLHSPNSPGDAPTGSVEIVAVAAATRWRCSYTRRLTLARLAA
jgi:CheY-like chemotaxis protein